MSDKMTINIVMLSTLLENKMRSSMKSRLIVTIKNCSRRTRNTKTQKRRI